MSRARRVLAIPRTGAPRCFRAHARFALCHPLAMKTDVLPRRKPIWPSPLSRLRERLLSEAFLTSLAFLTTHPYRALKRAASGANDRAGSVAIGTAAAIVRANLPGPARHDARCRSISIHEDSPNADYTCVCPGRGRRRYEQYVDVAAAVRDRKSVV